MHHFVNLDNVSNVMLSRNDIKLHVDSITLDKKTNKQRKESDRPDLYLQLYGTYPFWEWCPQKTVGVGGGGVCFFEKGADSIFCYKNFQSA